jgi:AcrR family transcriptional regulator
MGKKPRRTKRLTRDDWLSAAVEILRTRGIGGVRILTLAKNLGVTRGSFYWHFRDLQDLRDGMLNWWDRELTDIAIAHMKTVRGDARKRILALAEFVVRKDLSRYDAAVLAWAGSDPSAADRAERVMKKRQAFCRSYFREAGFSEAEAQARGNHLVTYMSGEASVLAGAPLARRLKAVRHQVRLLTTKA